MDRRQEAASSVVVAEAIPMSAQAECLLLDLAELRQQVEATLACYGRPRRATE